MELQKSKKNISNLLMVLAAVVIVAAGIYFALSFKGAPSEAEIVNGEVVVTSKTGNVNIERDGIGYSLADGDQLREGDLVETLTGANLTFKLPSGDMVTLEEGTEVVLDSIADDGLLLNRGTLFALFNSASDSALNVETKYGEYQAENGVAAFSSFDGSDAVYVLAGLVKEQAAPEATQVGFALNGVVDSDGKSDIANFSQVPLRISSLNDFIILQSIEASDSCSLCFTADELKSSFEKRHLGLGDVPTEDTEVIASTETSSQKSDKSEKADISAKDSSSSNSSTAGGSSDSSNSGSSSTPSKPDGSESQVDPVVPDNTANCQIQIRCDTILNNMGDLKPGKESFVPSNGIILYPSTVEISEGDTIFDVLTSVCDATGLQLEYSWTPGYDSYYIEGINNLYEFDCGSGSGWYIHLNGWAIDKGCSKIYVHEGDLISFDYTCWYGEDLS